MLGNSIAACEKQLHAILSDVQFWPHCSDLLPQLSCLLYHRLFPAFQLSPTTITVQLCSTTCCLVPTELCDFSQNYATSMVTIITGSSVLCTVWGSVWRIHLHRGTTYTLFLHACDKIPFFFVQILPQFDVLRPSQSWAIIWKKTVIHPAQFSIHEPNLCLWIPEFKIMWPEIENYTKSCGFHFICKIKHRDLKYSHFTFRKLEQNSLVGCLGSYAQTKTLATVRLLGCSNKWNLVPSEAKC